MSTLKEYTDTSKKSGFYILANVGRSHPITLQVTDIGAQILQKAGYQPEDKVPNNIVWPMYDVGILYTNETLDELPETNGRTDEVFDQLNVIHRLTPEERNQLIQYLNEYTGPRSAQVEILIAELQKQDTSERDSSANDGTASQQQNESESAEDTQPKSFWDFIKVMLKPPNIFSHGILAGLIAWFIWFPIGVSIATVALSLYIPYKILVGILAGENATDSEESDRTTSSGEADADLDSGEDVSDGMAELFDESGDSPSE